MNITKEQVLQALGNVEEPDLKKDLVTLNMIQDINIDGNKFSFSVILTTPACPLKGNDRKCLPQCHHSFYQQGYRGKYQYDLAGYHAKKYRRAGC